MDTENITKSICFSIFIILFQQVSGQTMIKGLIISTDKELLSGISLVVHPKEGISNMITFAIADQNGAFQFQYTYAGDSVGVSVRSMNYKDITIWLANKSQEMLIELPVSVHEIKEVRVKGQPIYGRGDTINYIVNSFAYQNDRSIGDVINRMPGFEVTERGEIYYQGNPIDKYYIEGLDLLEKRYAIANRNLPHQSVSSVEVLQNHQPIKMLESKIASDATSLNIKLKNGIAMTGTLYAGAGLSPFLHDINLTPMVFKKKQQMIASWQSNNTGNDLNTQHQPLEFSNGVFTGLENIKPEFVGISSVSHPPIETGRYLDNHANLLTYNHLVKVNPTSELKINGSYYNDKIFEEGSVTTSYFLDEQTLTINELTKNTYSKRSLHTDLTLTQNNASKYLNDQLSLNRFWDGESGVIRAEAEQSQRAKTPHISVSNVLDVLLPLKKNFLRAYSFIDYNSSPQKIVYQPGVFPELFHNGDQYEQTIQNYTVRNLVSHHYLQFTLGHDPWSLETETGVKYELQHMRTFIEVDGAVLTSDSLNNDLDWSHSEWYLKEKLQYGKGDIRAGIDLPVSLVTYHSEYPYHDNSGQMRKIFVSPSFYLKYDISKYLSAKSTLRYSSELGDASRISQGYILTSYRQMTKQAGKVPLKEGYHYRFELEYKNLVTGFFSTLLWSGARNSNNLLIQHNVSQTGMLYYEAINQKNRSLSDNIAVKLSQFLSGMQATIDLNGDYSRNKKEYLVTGSLGWLTNQLFSIKPAISISHWDFLDFEYSYLFQLIQQSSVQAHTSVTQQKHSGSMFITPSKQHLIGIKCEYHNIKQKRQGNFDVFFTNLSYRFKPSKGKLRYKVEMNNLFDISELVQFYNSDISIEESRCQLRPRQLIATVFFEL